MPKGVQKLWDALIIRLQSSVILLSWSFLSYCYFCFFMPIEDVAFRILQMQPLRPNSQHYHFHMRAIHYNATFLLVVRGWYFCQIFHHIHEFSRKWKCISHVPKDSLLLLVSGNVSTYRRAKCRSSEYLRQSERIWPALGICGLAGGSRTTAVHLNPQKSPNHILYTLGKGSNCYKNSNNNNQ